jgi:hypothetical protein
MQEQRNRKLLISLVLLTVVTAVIFYFTQIREHAQVDKYILKIQNIDQIDHVVLNSKEGKVDLKYNGSRWLVNGEFVADRNMIKVLFATLQQITPKRQLSESANDSILNSVKNDGVKVELYDGETMVKTFYAGGNELKTQGYISNGENGNVYLATIPGYRVYVSGIFELNEDGFRDKYVFPFNWQNFKSLQVEFPARPSENFMVRYEKEFFTISGENKVDTAKLNTFLDQVSLLAVNRFDSSISEDSVATAKPVMAVTIEDIANRKYLLKIFQPEIRGEVLGLIAEKPAFFSRQKIQQILKPKSFFINK